MRYNYRHIVRWDNAKPSYEEILRLNELLVREDLINRKGRTVDSNYPATLAVFKNERIVYNMEGIERYIVSKAYIVVGHIFDLLDYKEK